MIDERVEDGDNDDRDKEHGCIELAVVVAKVITQHKLILCTVSSVEFLQKGRL